MRYLKYVLSFFVCLIALCLPYRLRILYSEFIGWAINFFYKIYIGIINLIVRETV